MMITDFFDEKFPIDKIKDDFFKELFFVNGVAIINFYNIEKDAYIEIELRKTENFEITTRIAKNSLSGVYYFITLAVGNFVWISKEHGLFTSEKGFVDLKYNDDYSLYDFECYIDRWCENF